MLITAVYPGTFDPVTYGHIDLIKRGLEIFDELVVAVAHNPGKSPLFSVKERVEMLREVTWGMERVKVDDFNGLLVDYVKSVGGKVILRGVRVISDFELEFQMALTNRQLDESIETVFMMPKEEYAYFSSRIIKEISSLDADLKGFVPPFVEKRLKEKLRSEGK